MSPRPQTASADTAAFSAPPSPRVGPRQSRQRWLVVLGVGLVLILLIRGLLVQSFYIPSESMQPTLEPEDRILVNKIAVASSLKRGDLVVFDGTNTFADRGAADGASQGPGVGTVLGGIASKLSIRFNRSDYIKRVVGLPGDHVVCCDGNGLLTVNDLPVHEPYVYPGDRPSDVTFDVEVPSGRIWVMGDHRSGSADSRAHLGDPGGGMVPLDDVIGRAGLVYWPPDRVGILGASDSLGGIPASTAVERHKWA